MINILKVGLYSDRMHNEKCQKCNCLFEYDDKEIVSSNQYYFDDFQNYVACPQCGNKIEIKCYNDIGD